MTVHIGPLLTKQFLIAVHGANVGPIWGRQDPGGPHVGPMNFAIWGKMSYCQISQNLKATKPRDIGLVVWFF